MLCARESGTLIVVGRQLYTEGRAAPEPSSPPLLKMGRGSNIPESLVRCTVPPTVT